MPLTGTRRKSELAPDREFPHSGAPHELPTVRTSSTDRQTSRQWDYEATRERFLPLWCGRPARCGGSVSLLHGSTARAGRPCHSGRDARTTEERSVAQTAQPDYPRRRLVIGSRGTDESRPGTTQC
jgi:hypothetical protein